MIADKTMTAAPPPAAVAYTFRAGEQLQPEKLTKRESSTFAKLERRIRRGLDAFFDVAEALVAVREQKLYREKYGTFEEYCRKKWNMTARNARYRCVANEIAQNLLCWRDNHKDEPEPAPIRNHGSAFSEVQPDEEPQETPRIKVADLPMPTNERQIRPLSTLSADIQGPVWQAAVEKANGATPTGRQVDDAKADFLEAMKWPKPDARGEYSFEDVKETRHFVDSNKKAAAHVYVLQIGEAKWISAKGYSFNCGTQQNTGRPRLMAGSGFFPTRKEALLDCYNDLAAIMRVIIDSTLQPLTNKTQKNVARKILEWCLKTVRELEPQKTFEIKAKARPVKSAAPSANVTGAPEGLKATVIDLVERTVRLGTLLEVAQDEQGSMGAWMAFEALRGPLLKYAPRHPTTTKLLELFAETKAAHKPKAKRKARNKRRA